MSSKICIIGFAQLSVVLLSLTMLVNACIHFRKEIIWSPIGLIRGVPIEFRNGENQRTTFFFENRTSYSDLSHVIRSSQDVVSSSLISVNILNSVEYNSISKFSLVRLDSNLFYIRFNDGDSLCSFTFASMHLIAVPDTFTTDTLPFDCRSSLFYSSNGELLDRKCVFENLAMNPDYTLSRIFILPFRCSQVSFYSRRRYFDGFFSASHNISNVYGLNFNFYLLFSSPTLINPVVDYVNRCHQYDTEQLYFTKSIVDNKFRPNIYDLSCAFFEFDSVIPFNLESEHFSTVLSGPGLKQLISIDSVSKITALFKFQNCFSSSSPQIMRAQTYFVPCYTFKHDFTKWRAY